MSSSHKNGGSENGGVSPDWSEIRPAALAQLARILDSPHFKSSKRCSQFLRYVVEHATQNRFDRLKERTLGVEVFERDANYDTNQDPVVRIAAGEVRKRLAQYYLEPEHQGELRISLPAGSYIPDVQPATESAPARARPGRLWQPARSGVVLILAGCAVLAAAIWLLATRRATGLDRFWAPVIGGGDSVLVCIGQPKAYNFTAPLQGEVERWYERGARRDAAEPPRIPFAELVPMWNSYVALSDTQVLLRLSKLFASKGKMVQLRGGRTITLTDLRGRPCVLIGAFNNEWTLALAGELRFYFDVDPSQGAELVRDRQNPRRSDWKIVHAWPDRSKIPADFGIVTRVVNPTTEQTVIIAAGITHFGTLAAGEFLTNEAYFAEALAQAPRDWERRNMQAVFSAKVISGTAGPPKVLDAHFW